MLQFLLRTKAIVSEITLTVQKPHTETENINSWIFHNIYLCHYFQKITHKNYKWFLVIFFFFFLDYNNFLVGLKWKNIKFCIFKLVQFDFFKLCHYFEYYEWQMDYEKDLL